jgi:competence protein ComEC
MIGAEILRNYETVWRKYPAFMSGIPLLLGTAWGLDSHFLYPCLLSVWLLPLAFSPLQRKTLFFALCVFIGACLLTQVRCPLPQVPQEKCHGTGTFTFSTLKTQHSPFHRSLVYQGSLDFITDEGLPISSLPCALYHPSFSKHPPAHCSYEIIGTLVQKKPRFFLLKPDKNKAWIPIPDTFSFAEWRYRAKQALSHSLKTQISDPHTRTFLNALATGEIDDRILSLEFGKLGMQHILAISGFHFALIALFLGALLRLLFSYQPATLLLLLLLSFYAFFLGNSPSVLRAWIALSVFLIGVLINRRTSALNALGVGLWIELLFNPLVVTHVGFQLSFLCTLAILSLMPFCSTLVNRLTPKRQTADLLQMSRLDQHGYLAAAYLRTALSVNLAVLIASVPVLLLLFHRFPLLSIVYNLFFPLCISLSLLLLCSACLLSAILPPIGSLIHALNNAWTSAVLTFSSEPPAFCDLVIRMKNLPFPAVALYLTLLFMGALCWNEKQKNELFLDSCL